MRALIVSALLAIAPYQCGRSTPPDAREDTPAEALYTMAGRLKEQGDAAGWRSTLQYLLVKYPGSRFAVAARIDLSPDSGPSPR